MKEEDLLDWFAGMALTAILSNEPLRRYAEMANPHLDGPERHARLAYESARAMLAVKERLKAGGTEDGT